MAKTKKISINAFEKAMKSTYTPTETFDWNGVKVTVKKTLSLREMMEFVGSVVKSCFTKDTHEYTPEVQDFAIKTCILEKYANFSMPSNLELQYDLIYCTDAVQAVLRHINHEQFSEIEHAIETKLEYAAKSNIESANAKIEEGYMSIEKMLGELEEAMSKTFDGVDKDQINKFIKDINEGEIDNEKLVEAYINSKKASEGK